MKSPGGGGPSGRQRTDRLSSRQKARVLMSSLLLLVVLRERESPPARSPSQPRGEGPSLAPGRSAARPKQPPPAKAAARGVSSSPKNVARQATLSFRYSPGRARGGPVPGCAGFAPREGSSPRQVRAGLACGSSARPAVLRLFLFRPRFRRSPASEAAGRPVLARARTMARERPVGSHLVSSRLETATNAFGSS
jgi:hypothetical protein